MSSNPTRVSSRLLTTLARLSAAVGLRRPVFLLLVAFTGSILASIVPVALSVKELSALSASVVQITDSSSVARQVRDVGEKFGLALTDFTAIALDLDPAERASILSETDKHISQFAESLARLKLSIKHWLNERQDLDLSEATEALRHSWEEIRDQPNTELSGEEKAFHFLQMSDNARRAQGVLNVVEARISGLADAQTKLAFERLRFTGTLLLAAIIVGFAITSFGSLSIFRSLQTTWKTNARLQHTEAALKRRSDQLVEAHRLGKLADWSYRLGEPEFWWAQENFEILRYDPESFRPTREAVLSILVGDGARRILDAQAEVVRTQLIKRIDVKMRRGDGSVGDFDLTSKAMIDGEGRVVGFTGTIQDISDRKNAEERLEKLAYYDPLTGLANRALFLRELEDELIRHKQTGTQGALLLLDLDHFKEVNDTLGHVAGDELLVKATHLIARALNNNHFFGRLGGDEFAIIIRECGDQAEITRLAEKVIASVSGSIMLGAGETIIGTSIGVALFPRDGSNSSDLLRNADLALYQAKEEGRGCFVFFKPDMNAIVQHKVALARDLRSAISEDTGLAVHYQPQVDLSTGRVCGYEALLRWNHPTRGNIPPSEFIPIAESSRLISDLGLWILRHAVIQAKAWLDAGEPPRQIAVNMSAAQIWHTDVVREVAGVLEETGLPPHLLCIELTESLLVNHAEGRVRTVLKALKDLGVMLALDDFGTDYSSLGYLTQLPFDKLKIDRLFVDGITDSDRACKLLQGIIALGRGLGMTVVGEGAEKAGEIEILREFGCDWVQGYVFARPMPAADALAYARGCDKNEVGVYAAASMPGQALRALAVRMRSAAA